MQWTTWFTQRKRWNLYRGGAASSFAVIQRPGHKVMLIDQILFSLLTNTAFYVIFGPLSKWPVWLWEGLLRFIANFYQSIGEASNWRNTLFPTKLLTLVQFCILNSSLFLITSQQLEKLDNTRIRVGDSEIHLVPIARNLEFLVWF